MSQKSNYVSTNRSKHYLKCHLIFVCRYRKAMLAAQVNDDAKRIFSSIAENSDFEIEVMETDKDHVHAQIVHRLKQESTRQLWLLHGKTLRKQYWYQHLFW